MELTSATDSVGDADNFRLFHQPPLSIAARSVPSTPSSTFNPFRHVVTAVS